MFRRSTNTPLLGPRVNADVELGVTGRRDGALRARKESDKPMQACIGRNLGRCESFSPL